MLLGRFSKYPTSKENSWQEQDGVNLLLKRYGLCLATPASWTITQSLHHARYGACSSSHLGASWSSLGQNMDGLAVGLPHDVKHIVASLWASGKQALWHSTEDLCGSFITYVYGGRMLTSYVALVTKASVSRVLSVGSWYSGSRPCG